MDWTGFGSEVRIRLGGQELAGTVGLEQDSSGVVRKQLDRSAAGDSMQTATCLTLQKFTLGTVGEFAFTVETYERGNRQCNFPRDRQSTNTEPTVYD